jgi:hypothetical protein
LVRIKSSANFLFHPLCSITGLYRLRAH